MKKRLISWLLILALCVSVLPAAALAAEPEDTALTGAEQTVDPAETEPESDPAEAKQTITPAEPLRAVSANSGTETHKHYRCGGATCNKEGHDDEGDNKVTFTAWPGINSVVNGGAYYLTTDLNGLTVKSGVNLTLCLNGCSITGGWDGPVITVEPGATLTLCDCNATYTHGIRHTGSGHGTGVLVGKTVGIKDTVGANDAVFNMYGGYIYGNTPLKASVDNAGSSSGVTVAGGTFNLYGGTIRDNKAYDYGDGGYGGVFVCNQGTFNMSGGEITGNTTYLEGAGVFVGGLAGLHDAYKLSGGTFNMSGGTITGNTAGSNGGGVYVSGAPNAHFTISGSARITDNYKGNVLSTTNGTTNNVYLGKNTDDKTGEIISIATIEVKGTLTGSIGVTTEDVDHLVATGVSTAAKKCFSSDSKSYTLKYSGAAKTLTMVKATTTTHTDHPVCGDAGCKDHEILASWTGISDLSKITQNGNYYLTDDVELDNSWTCWNDVKLCLNGHSIIENADKNAISLTSSATLTLCDCVGGGEIMHGTDANGETYTGAGVSVPSTQTFNMYGGTITGNKNTFGGGVLLGNGSTFNMYGGKITGNKADANSTSTSDGLGGGVCAKGVSGGAKITFNMYGGTIEDNTATYRGGGVYVGNDAQFSMSGGSITGNTAAQGGGVYYTASNSLYVSGNVNITDNKGTDGKANNVYVPSSSGTPKTVPFYIAWYVLNEDARIGVRVDDNLIATGEHSPVAQVSVYGDKTNAYHEGNFIPDNGGDYGFKLEEKDKEHIGIDSTHVVNLYNGLPHKHAICGKTAENCTDSSKHDDVVWTLLTSDTSGQPYAGSTALTTGQFNQTQGYVLPAGHYYLNAELNLNKPLLIKNGVSLCLNGKTLTVSSNNSAVIIDTNCDLTLCDCSEEQPGTITHATGATGRGVYMGISDGKATDYNGSFTMYGGSISGNHVETGSGVGVYVCYGTFNMHGGSITDNTTKDSYASGGVHVTGGTFNMTGGSITDNSATSSSATGGGVRVDSKGTFNMSGDAVISNNSGAYSGGGVYVNTATFNMSGNAAITGNSADYGGGVYVTNGTAAPGTFTMSGNASISGNSANYGGGVYMRESNSKFTMSESATVSGNTAKAAGGGVNLIGGGTFTMGSGSITGNNVTGPDFNSSGGGVCVSTGTFNMTGGTISGNNVTHSDDTHDNEGGGGVYVAENATMNVSGNVQITGNWKNGTLNNGVYEKGVTGSDNNLYLYAYNSGTTKVLKTVAINGALDGAKIGVTTRYTPTADAPIQFATGATNDLAYYTNIFTPDVQGQGYTITQTDNKLYLSAHQHSWQYAAGADTIAVSCNADGCNLNGQTFYYVLSASDSTYDGKGKPASVTPPTTTGVTLPETPTISYTQTKPILQQLETRAVPTNAGTYMASITMGGKTASVTYEIKKTTPQASDISFTAPTNLTYDGTPKYPKFTPGIGGVTVYPTYYDAGGNAVSPINVGTYTVKIKVEVSDNDNYNSVNELTSGDWTFTILQADYTGQKSDKTIDIVKGRSAAQSGSLTVADFFPAETQLPAGAKIASVTGSGTMMESVTVNDGTLAYTSTTNITATENESYTVTISTTNYNNFTVTLTFHPVEKQPQTNFGFKDVVGGKVAKVYGADTEFTLAATGAATGSTVTYESTDTNVATVDGTGKVTIHGAGTAVIKATASATDGHAEGKAEYTLTINPKTLTKDDLVATGDIVKTYDGTTTATGITVRVKDGVLVNGDTLPITGSAEYNSKDVATANTITFTPNAITEGNYRLAATEQVTITNGVKINKRVLTVGTVTTKPKTYNTLANALDCVTGIELNRTVSGETLRFYTSAETGGDYGIYETKFDNANAGQNKTITGTVALLESSALASNYTFEVDGKESSTAPFTATGEITQADSWALTPVNDLTIRYNNRDPQTYTPNWSTLLPTGQIWTYNSENTAYTGSANLSTNTIGADTGVLSYQLSAGNAGDTVTWTITASCSNYQTFTLTVTLSLIARDPQTNFKFENNTTSVSKTYGDEDFTIKATDAAAGSTVSYESSNTSVATVDNTGKVTIVGAGQTTIKAKASATADFEEKEISYTLKVNKLRIHVPTPGKNKLQYDGTTQTYTPDGLNTTYCSITNNTAKDVLANNANYTATVSLRDTANTEWNEGVDNTTPRECQFWILPARAIVTALDKKITTGQPAPDLTTAKLGEDYTITGLYDGDSLGSIGLYYADPADTATEVTTPDTSKAGTYAIVAKLDGEGNSNYILMSVPGTLTIEAVQTSQKLGISAPGRTPGGSYELTPKNAQPGDTVTISVSPDKGCELGSLTVRDMDGNELDLKRDRSGDYTFTMPKSSVSVSISFVRADDALFDDVLAGDYYYNAVQWAAEQGITGGVGGNLFAPDAACTRAQIVTFLWRAAGSPAPKTMSAFADVPATAYYAKAVAWAVENGITNGTGDGKFSPDAPCTRAQAVTFLARALDESADGAADFTDVSADAYYAKPVAWAVESAVTNGVSETRFAPNETCTRAQIVTFLYRAYKRMK